ncbi:tail fiber assembly protein, partial [Escherichia coli]|uniref:tail fiber assembly protein n=1 Tax=Escherichia coli TaxID=562 RepID=UPI002023A73E
PLLIWWTPLCLIRQILTRRFRLYAYVDLEIATEEETLLLEAWKKYRVLLNRVDTSTAPDIEWPALP